MQEVKHIDIESTAQDENPLCFQNINGKVRFNLKKEFNEALVTITK